jgi:hypothetical protein
MPNSFERRTMPSPEFDLSSGKKYAEEDFAKLAVGPDDVLITAKKNELLELAARAKKRVRVTLATGGDVEGRLRAETIAGEYTCVGMGNDESISADNVRTIEIL